jgi:hypothetical protein
MIHNSLLSPGTQSSALIFVTNVSIQSISYFRLSHERADAAPNRGGGVTEPFGSAQISLWMCNQPSPVKMPTGAFGMVKDLMREFLLFSRVVIWL